MEPERFHAAASFAIAYAACRRGATRPAGLFGLFRNTLLVVLGAAGVMVTASVAGAQENGPTAQPAPPLLVEATQAQERVVRLTVSLTGEIEARQTLNASFRSAGRIASISVEEGDAVQQGQELARIESVSQEQSLRSSIAALTTAQANLTQAQTEFKRQDALLERGATTRASRDSAEDTLLSAEASVAEAQAARDLTQKNFDDTVLVAPRDALVTVRDAEVGQVVGAAETVIMLALGAQYDAVIEVPEVLLTVPREAPPVTLELIDEDAGSFSGVVREVSPLVDPELGTIQVKIGLIDAPDTISIGGSVRSTVALDESPVVSLPFSALTATSLGSAVWVIDADDLTVSLRQVDVQRHETHDVLIREGLSDGELVVTRGGQLLFEGQTVRLSPEGIKP